MSMFNPQLQIISDLHLETPLAIPSYSKFRLQLHSNILCLLGDIGLVKDAGLFTFLENLLSSTSNLRIFYVLGNHEAYQMTLQKACQTLEQFEQRMRTRYGHRFHFLNGTRYDLTPEITILGCTLWTHIPKQAASEAQNRLTDFNDRGIKDRDVNEHNSDHEKDLSWLNSQVQQIEEAEPHRRIIILTHHSPTTDPRANDPRHNDRPENSIQSGFVTDLSKEHCWISPAVKAWAFGHTHYSCLFRDEQTDKLVVANQKGNLKSTCLPASRGGKVLLKSSEKRTEFKHYIPM
ncbi:hypothetical protein BT63DRAFT_433030 [Microthyrium microscopicum]|uniref:Calcineurin-like phosphoesterase domain-containing protein n=1 Tax=Microthyrium microscopicum TaxID=703497 RepID=A0A6A6UBS3_9PEZI|nr:hypothetical protein BT63DRAFT_433030 [Microthyrium microscopicum]